MHGNFTSDSSFNTLDCSTIKAVRITESFLIKQGFNGNILAQSVPQLGTLKQELICLELEVSCPPELKRLAGGHLTGWIRRAVFLHNDINDKNDVFKPKNSCETRTFSAVEIDNLSLSKKRRRDRRG